MNGLPEWLEAHLKATGRFNADGVARSARLRNCPDCGAKVLRGLDGDRAAFPVICDPHEIDANGETVALMCGLRTYSLTRSGTASGMAWNLDARLPAVVAAEQRTAVVAQHRCGMAVPPSGRSFLPAWMNKAATDSTDPPF